MIGANDVAKVHAGVITSEPSSKLSAHKPNRMADEPLLTKRPYDLPKHAAMSSSNLTVRGPKPASHPSCGAY